MSSGPADGTPDGAGASSRRTDPHRYLSFYGLKSPPFRVSTDPQYLWPGKTRTEMLETLTAAIRHGEGIVLLTGDIGTGKTTLVNSLVDRLTADGPVVGRMFNFGFEPSELLRAAAQAFGIKDDFETRAEFFARLQQLLAGESSPPRKALLIIDDAQDLSHELLDEIRDLSMAGAAHGDRLAILLVGHKKLNAMVSLDRHAALRQRITAGADVDPLTPEEVGEYIRYVLRRAGSEEEIFTPQAVLELAALSGGVPRVINMLGDLALLTGLARRARTIDREIIEEARKKLGSPRQIVARRVRDGRRGGQAAPRRIVDSNARLVRKRRGAGRAAPLYSGVLAALVLMVATYVVYHGWRAGRPDGVTDTARDAAISDKKTRAISDAAPTPPHPAVDAAPAAATVGPGELLIERATHEEPTPLPPKSKPAVAVKEAKPVDPKEVKDPQPRPSAVRVREKKTPAPSIETTSRAGATETMIAPDPVPQRRDGDDPGAVIDWLLKERR